MDEQIERSERRGEAALVRLHRDELATIRAAAQGTPVAKFLRSAGLAIADELNRRSHEGGQ